MIPGADSTQELVRAADIELAITEQLFSSLRLPMLMVVMACLSTSVLLWAQGCGLQTLPLLTGLLGIGLGALLMLQRFSQASEDVRRQSRWRRYAILLGGLGGGSMALSAIWLMPSAPVLSQALCMSLITAANVLSASSNAICPRVHLSFSLSSLLPLSIVLLEQSHPAAQQWGLFSLALLLTLLISGWLTQQLLHHSLVSDLQNRALLRQQEHSRRMTEILNHELGREIFERESIEQELLSTKWKLESQVRERQQALTSSEQALRREAENRQYLASHDQLTGLGNRRLLLQRLEDAATHLHLHGHDGNLALLLLDIDRFKWINESLGHDLADEVLRQVAQRLNANTDNHITLARMAVDEFAILLDQALPRDALEALASTLLQAIRQPLQVGTHQLRLSASIGIALYPGHSLDVQEIIGRANQAVSHVKKTGGNHYQFYNDSLHSGGHERLMLEARLDQALECGQLVVHYQPRLTLITHKVESAEALVRWNHPELGMVSPASFIGLAEETGQICAIGTFVLRQACLDARRWLQAGHPPLRVSVNVSTHQLRQGDFIEQVSAILDYTGLPPHLLELELTESQLSVDMDVLVEHVQRLRQLGIQLAIDDFGTGYSSLSHLRQLPVDVVKIDRSFIQPLGQQGSDCDAAIARAIIAMAHSLQLKVVAEGVEEEAQLEFLRANHCDEVQGFWFSKPLPASEMTRLLGEATYA